MVDVVRYGRGVPAVPVINGAEWDYEAHGMAGTKMTKYGNGGNVFSKIDSLVELIN